MLVRKSFERGKNNIHWLNANHTFSFGHYYDPRWTSFHQLLVINEDTIAPAMGFGTHPHNNMEIITYIINGEIKHRDSMGSVGVINPGEIQVMSAGTGVAHSEFNNLEDNPTHLLQIWIHPNRQNLKPRYAQKKVYQPGESNFLRVIAGMNEDNESVIKLNADAQIWLGKYNREETIKFRPKLFNQYWIQIVKGNIAINAQTFTNGDGIAFNQGEEIEMKLAAGESEFLIFEVGE